jgi:heme exporter protein B
VFRNLGWMIHKDLIGEFRARRAWPTMLLMGIAVALVFRLQLDVPAEQQPRLLGGLLWLAVFFAGMTAVDRSCAAEREDGCWETWKLLPVSPSLLYLAKVAVNFSALSVLELLLVPLFCVLAHVPFTAAAGRLVLIAGLANLGLAAIGTLVSALAAGQRFGNALVLLVLPVSIPVVLAAAESTRLALAGPLGEAGWRWLQLLGVFAVIFITAGTLLFEFAWED